MKKIKQLINIPTRELFSYSEKTLRIVKKLAEYLFSAIIFILIPLIAFTLITSRTSALFGLQSFTVLSGSMSPAIPVGSIIYTNKIDKASPGDVIIFHSKNVNVTHRVLETVDKNGNRISGLVSPLPGTPDIPEIFYKTQGDANNSPDSDLVPQEKVVGKVIFNVPSLGRYTSFLKTIPGFLMFIIFPTLIFVGFELWNIKKEIEKQTERKVLERLRIV